MRVLRAIHQWIGIGLAVPILLVALSGGLLVFRDPYYRARHPSLARPVTIEQEAEYARILGDIEERFASPGVRAVKFPRAGFNAFHVYLSDRSEALVDAGTGAPLARWDRTTSAPAFLFDLHAHLLGGATGETVNGFIALAIVFFDSSGLLLWWPRRHGAFRLRHAVPRRVTHVEVLRAHAASGVFLLVPVVIFSATGAGLVFYEPAARAMSALVDRTPPAAPTALVAPSTLPRRPWKDILATARHTLPEAAPAMYYPGPRSNAVLTFRKSLPGEWHPNGRSYVLIDPYTATAVQAIDARAQGAGTRMMHALYPLHAAKAGGAALASVALLSALGLAWLAAGSSWAFLGKVLARSVLWRRRADANGGEGSGADRRDRRSALHAHEPGQLSAPVHTSYRRG